MDITKITLETVDVVDKDGKTHQEIRVNSKEFYDLIIKKSFDITGKITMVENQPIELDVLFNPGAGQITFIGDPLTKVNDIDWHMKHPEFSRIGTIGNINFRQMKEVRIIDEALGVFELDDGKASKYHIDRYEYLNPSLTKRTMIDSSLGTTEDLISFWREKAEHQYFFDEIVNNANKLLN